MTNEMTISQIKACIRLNESNYITAFQNLLKISNEIEKAPYHAERLIAAEKLCGDIAASRAKLEAKLQQALKQAIA